MATPDTVLERVGRFDVQNRSFQVVSCANCGYAELYKSSSSGNLADLFLG